MHLLTSYLGANSNLQKGASATLLPADIDPSDWQQLILGGAADVDKDFDESVALAMSSSIQPEILAW